MAITSVRRRAPSSYNQPASPSNKNKNKNRNRNKNEPPAARTESQPPKPKRESPPAYPDHKRIQYSEPGTASPTQTNGRPSRFAPANRRAALGVPHTERSGAKHPSTG